MTSEGPLDVPIVVPCGSAPRPLFVLGPNDAPRWAWLRSVAMPGWGRPAYVAPDFLGQAAPADPALALSPDHLVPSTIPGGLYATWRSSAEDPDWFASAIGKLQRRVSVLAPALQTKLRAANPWGRDEGAIALRGPDNQPLVATLGEKGARFHFPPDTPYLYMLGFYRGLSRWVRQASCSGGPGNAPWVARVAGPMERAAERQGRTAIGVICWPPTK